MDWQRGLLLFWITDERSFAQRASCASIFVFLSLEFCKLNALTIAPRLIYSTRFCNITHLRWSRLWIARCSRLHGGSSGLFVDSLSLSATQPRHHASTTIPSSSSSTANRTTNNEQHEPRSGLNGNVATISDLSSNSSVARTGH